MPTIALWLLALLQTSPQAPAEERPSDALVIDRGGGQELRVPRDEKLVFRVRMEIGFVEADVGKVTMQSHVEPYRTSVLGPAPSDASAGTAVASPEVGVFGIRAVGGYAWYSMDSTIESRILPQEWPQITYRYSHAGSEQRRREVLIGLRDGSWTSSYRRDTDRGAPEGTRIWRDPKVRAVAPQTIDLLSAVYLARNLIREGEESMQFPLIDKQSLWSMRLTRGREEPVVTPAGTFDSVEIRLDPAPFEGEEIDEEKVERFEGLFGLHGTIHLWVERRTGVPVRIQGILPAGPLDLDIDISLESSSGTPPEFAPRPAAAPR
jgi:hypothetical protein